MKTEKRFKLYTLGSYDNRNGCANDVNDYLEHGWDIQEMAGIGGSNATSPMLGVIFEKQTEENNAED